MKRFRRLQWAIKANNGVFTEGDFAQFCEFWEHYPQNQSTQKYSSIVPVTVKSFYSQNFYEVLVNKRSVDNIDSFIDKTTLNWGIGTGIKNSNFIPSKIIIHEITDPQIKTSEITGWQYKTPIKSKNVYPIGDTNLGASEAEILEKAENSARDKNKNNRITVTPERWK